MTRLTGKASIALLCLVLAGCDGGGATGTDGEDAPVVSREELDHFAFEQTDYDSVRVYDTGDLVLDSTYVLSVALIEESSGTIMYQDSIPAQYDTLEEDFALHFDFRRGVFEEHLLYPFTLRFLLTDLNVIDFQALNLMYKYPYPETEILLDLRNLFREQNLRTLQDIDRTSTHLYYHSFGDYEEGYDPASRIDGIGQYDLASGEASWLIRSVTDGDRIAASDAGYVYFDTVSTVIGRFNLSADSVDLWLSIRRPEDTGGCPDVSGLDVYNGELYALVRDVRCYFHVVRYTLDLVPVDSIAIDLDRRGHITLHNGTLYISDWPSRQLLRFDLATQQYIEPVRAPSRSPSAIAAYDGNLYFYDHLRDIIGVVPVASLTP